MEYEETNKDTEVVHVLIADLIDPEFRCSRC